MVRHLLPVPVLLLAAAIQVQSAIASTVQNSLVETQNGSIVVMNGIDTSAFRVYVHLRDRKMNLTQDDRAVFVDGNVFQVLLVDEERFGKPNSVFTLGKYAKTELAFLRDSVYGGQELTSKVELIDRKSTELKVTAVFWYYETPPDLAYEVKNHLYVCFSYKDRIVGIYMPQLAGRDFEQTKELLFEVFNSVRFASGRVTLEELCSEAAGAE